MKVSPWEIVKIWWHVRKVKRSTNRKLTQHDFLEASFAVNALNGDAENAGYYYAVGAMTVNWAAMELYLDICNSLLIHYRKTTATRAPQNLGSKLRVFGNAFENEPTLCNFSQRAAEIVSEVSRLREIRHDIIHGIVIEKQETGERRFHRFTFNRNIGERRIQNYTFEQILNYFREMLALRGQMLAFTQEFTDSLDAHDGEVTRG